jgi:hypothetical protein
VRASWLGVVLGVLGCTEPVGAPPERALDLPSDSCGPSVPVCRVDLCHEAVCSAVEIARVPGRITELAVDGTHAYFVAAKALYRVPKCGGSVELVVTGAFGIRGVTLHGDFIYWFDVEGNQAPNLGGGFHRTPKALGATEAIDPLDVSPSAAVGLAVDDEAVYVARTAAPGIQRVDSHGSTLLKNSGVPGPLLVDELALYFVSGSPTFISTMSKTGGPSTQVYLTNQIPFVQNSSSLFFFGPPGGGNYALVQGSKRGGVPSLMDASVHAGTALAVDENCLYAGWATSPEPELWIQRSPIGAPSWTPFVAMGGQSVLIALDDASAYFGITSSDGSAGSVLRRPK